MEKKDDVKELNYSEHPCQGLVKAVGETIAALGTIKVGDYVFLDQVPRRAIMYNEKWYALVQRPNIVAIL